jgi:benzoyl-CoA 2,3-dioxygenase component B
MLKITNFDDWIDYFYGWQKDIGLDAPEFKDYRFEAKYGEVSPEIEFSDYKGGLRWKTVMHIPDQRVRDAALNLIVYQGDTEFASVEQQRKLFEMAPSRYDYLSLVRVMTEEMRHGWQMSRVLVSQFGRSGRIEAQKLLECRAFEDDRLLGAFNEPVRNWLDFFTYTQFVDRDGKFQVINRRPEAA